MSEHPLSEFGQKAWTKKHLFIGRFVNDIKGLSVLMEIKWTSGFDDFDDAYLVRKNVFVFEQNVDESIEIDEFDSVSIHIVIYDNALPIATGRIFKMDKLAVIGRVSVLKDYRGKNVGKMLMEKLLEKAESMNPEAIKLDSQLHAIEFYRQFWI
ncbi:MAG: GNAT family N-acetyltransferase [Methanolobus sp.]